MKRLTIAMVAFTALAFPAVLMAAVSTFGCCVLPCHSMKSPTVPMCSAAPTQTVVNIVPPQQAVLVAPMISLASSPAHSLAHRSRAVDRDVGLFILLATLII